MSKYAPKRADGLYAYVITKSSWGKSWDRIEWAESLAVARQQFGWTRERYTTITVRRATPSDLEQL